MSTVLRPSSGAAALAATLMCGFGCGVHASGEPAAATPPTDAAPKAVEKAASATVSRLGLAVQPSVFEDNYASGVDPFFPASRRRHPKNEVITEVAPSESAPSGRIEQLSLKGITGLGTQRLALINNRPFASGESGSVRIPGGQMLIRVLELGERSVKVRIEGDPKTHEIKLEDRTYDFTQAR
jgi:hypothetical protein